MNKETKTMTMQFSVAAPFRRAARLAASLAVVAAALALVAGSAAGAQTHELVASFGSFTNPNGVTVDASGDVYVADIGADTVQKFDASGNPVNFSGLGSNTLTGSGGPASSFSFANPAAIAVDNSAGSSAGDLYVLDTNNNAVDKFAADGAYVCQVTGAGSASASTSECDKSAAGAPGGAFTGLDGLSVDGAGNLWVYRANDEVDEFSPAGVFLSSFGTAHGTNPGFAVDSTDHSFAVLDSGAVEKFDSTGSDLGSQDGGFANSVATDLTSGHVFVDDGSQIDEYDGSLPTGQPVSEFGSVQLTNSSSGGIAVNPASGNVFVANPADGKVYEFGPLVTVPDATTGQASNLTTSSATLNGSVNPDSTTITDCHFDYGTDTTYGKTAPCVSTPAGSTATPVSADISGLTPNTTFHFRLEAANANGTSYADDQTLTTPGPPSIDGETTDTSSQDISTSELLQAQINPDGLDTTYHVEYGTADCSSSPCTTVPVPDADIGPGTSDVGVSQRIAGLQLNTTYHFRVVATNSAGTTDGADVTFMTGKGFGIANFGVQATNQDGTLDTQAGSHPYQLTTSIVFNTVTVSPHTQRSNVAPEENAKDIITNLPPGLIGDPTGIPQCTEQQLSGNAPNPSMVEAPDPNCPAASQVGVLSLILDGGEDFNDDPVFNMVPPRGEIAQFGVNLTEVDAFIDISIRTGGDYGVTATVSNPSTLGALISSQLTLWGVPAELNGSGDPSVPLLTLPTSCTGPLTSTVSADSYQHPGQFVNASYTSQDAAGNPVGMNGCAKLDFRPTITAQPDTTVADSPAGLSVNLQMRTAGLLDPNGLAEADLKDATVTLPAGVSLNPSSATGLAACAPGQIGLNNANEPSCPDASEIGTVEVDTPLLPDPLTGGIYVAQQGNNPFNSLLAIYVTAEGDGALIKLAGHVVADPVTGQLTTTFDNNPQLPFTDFKLDFFGGPRGVLATPESCGTFSSSSDLTPWNGAPDATSSDSFTIDSGCVSGFSPSFSAGTMDPQAGAYSPFVLSFQRSDTDQDLSGLAVKLPPGMLARLAGVQECSDAQLAAAAANTGAAEQANPSCPAGSQVGTVQTGAGPGPDSVFLGGKAYLTGPYKGAPYGLAVIVPAVAGPYDLGTVVVRQALYIDPTTAQVTAVSDTFPTILQGIPLRLRRVEVTLNRPDFTLNPTSCDPMSVTGILSSTGGLAATLSPHFQVGGCQDLDFSPKLTLALTGKGKTRSGDHPTLTATLTQPSGQANIHTAKVALPLSLALDPNNSQHVCSYDVAQAVHGGAVGCPASSIVGTASALTPLLSQPLSGPVYLVQGIRFGPGGVRIRTLPSLLVPLRGQIALDLRASSSVNGAQQLVTTFSTIPDAPVSKFTLQINGGPKGLVVITGRGRSICTAKQVANADLGAQSGRTNSQNDTMATPCARPARLAVLSHRIEGHAMLLRVRTSARGRVTVSGEGLQRFSKVLSAGTHRLRVGITNGASAARVRSVKVTLQPADAQGATHTFRTRE